MMVYAERYFTATEQLAEEWADGGYTRWDEQGNVVEQRALTADEVAYFVTPAQDVQVEEGRRGQLRDRLRLAVVSNRTYLALAAPTAAETRTQVERLTRQTQALIWLAIHDTADMDPQ
jgi:hypothetical protein